VAGVPLAGNPKAEQRWLLTLREAALRVRLNTDTLRRAIRAGDLHASGGGRPGIKLLIHPDDLDDWLERRRGGRPEGDR
jgi:excisionase family DNA binding protein